MAKSPRRKPSRNMNPTPRNMEKDIDLFDQNGDFLEKISQSDASRMLKHITAELLFLKPPAIRLTVPVDN